MELIISIVSYIIAYIILSILFDIIFDIIYNLNSNFPFSLKVTFSICNTFISIYAFCSIQIELTKHVIQKSFQQFYDIFASCVLGHPRESHCQIQYDFVLSIMDSRDIFRICHNLHGPHMSNAY